MQRIHLFYIIRFYRLYIVLTAGCFEMRAVAKSTFRKLWRQLVPYVVHTQPMTDLCWECQQNNEALYHSANLPDSMKSAKVQQQEQHLTLVQQERSLYNTMVQDAKLTVAASGITTLSQHEPCSNDFCMHYSFDFAQQVHYPNSPLQPGPMYFWYHENVAFSVSVVRPCQSR